MLGLGSPWLQFYFLPVGIRTQGGVFGPSTPTIESYFEASFDIVMTVISIYLLWDSSMLCRRHLSCDCDVIEVMMTSLILLMVMTFKLWRHQLWWLELLLWHHLSWYCDVTDVFSCDIIEVEPSSVVTSSVTIWIVGTKTNQSFFIKNITSTCSDDRRKKNVPPFLEKIEKPKNLKQQINSIFIVRERAIGPTFEK